MKSYDVVIVGAGSGGLAVAARLANKGGMTIAIVDPAEFHYYQPLWTLVGGGEAMKEQSRKPMKELIPRGIDWLQDYALSFAPSESQLTTKATGVLVYKQLVVATGLQINWDATPGLKEAIGHDGVCSNYSFETVDSTWEAIRNFKGGTALFTQPSSAIKCGGAPQKIMYLADDYFRQNGVRDGANVVFMSGLPTIFAVEKYAKTLNEVIAEKKIEAHYLHDLIAIDGKAKKATFRHIQTGEETTLSYDIIHVTPTIGPLQVVKESPLVDAAGWIDVDAKTLRHKKFENVFVIGDCTNLPTSKTGAAIRKQAPVVANRVAAALKGRAASDVYDGYTSCPLVTGYNKLVLAEFDYDKVPQETFPFDQSKQRRSMYLLKKHLLPKFYWYGMLTGRM